MTILAIDTTTTMASVALRRDGQNLAEITIASSEGFGHLLFPAIEKFRNENQMRLADIDCFAAAAGPGSFTGVRIGLAAVKGLAEATAKRVAGISNLQALSVFGASPANELPRAVVLDARRGEFYSAVYDSAHRLVMDETVGPLDAWLRHLDAGACYEFITAAGTSIEDHLANSPFSAMPRIEAPAAQAAAIAQCAEQAGPDAWLDPADLEANYVRRSDAELFWRE